MFLVFPVTAFLGLIGSTLGVDCTKVPPGIYEIACKSYVTCGSDGTLTRTPCMGKMVFNTKTLQCDDPTKVPKPCGIQEDCSLKENRKYSDLSMNCSSYFTCSGGVYFGHNFCPAHLVFNDILQACDWPNRVYPPCGTLDLVTTSVP